MGNKRSRTPDDEVVNPLADRLVPLLDVLSEAAQARERAEREQAERERVARLRLERRRLDEAELMALIFAHLDPENPRVYVGIEFDRLVILAEAKPDRPAPVEAEPSPAEPVLAEPAPPEPALPGPARVRVDPRTWVGRDWADDIRPIPAEVLDRPALDPRQRELLTRASRRELASLNLRRLGRDQALAHLELFVHACRAERVRFCRVIPGKGVGSKAEPVLKRAVIDWCRATGERVIGWAPELDTHGEWGAMIVELRSLG